MRLVDHVIDHMLDHVLDYILDHIIIGLVTTELQLPSSLTWAPTNK